MEKGRVKLFAEVNDQEIRYAAFELADNSNYNLSQAVDKIETSFDCIDNSIKDIIKFIQSSSRGLI